MLKNVCGDFIYPGLCDRIDRRLKIITRPYINTFDEKKGDKL